MIVTPQILWEGYDPQQEALNATKLVQTATDAANCYSLYFDGEKADNGATIRIFAKLYTPLEVNKTKNATYFSDNNLVSSLELKNITAQMVIVFDDILNSVDDFDPSIYLNEGFCVLVVDYAGSSNNKSRFTIYPKEFNKANYFLNPEALNETDTPKDSSWYIWQTVAMRSCFLANSLGAKNLFMLGVGHGLEMVFKTAYFDDMIKAGVTQGSGGVKDAKNLQYTASLDATAYAQHAKCPILMQVPSNEQNGSLDGISALFETLSKANSDSRFSIEPRSVKYINKKAPLEWFKTILNYDNLCFTPTISAKVSQDKLYFNITADASLDFGVDIGLFVAHIEPNPALRNWRIEPLQSIGEGEYLATIDVINSEEPLFAFLNIRYNNYLCFCSPILTINPSILGIKGITAAQKRLIYDTDMLTLDFINADFCDGSIDNDTLELKDGALGLNGLFSSKNSLLTFKLTDPQYRGVKEANLQLMIQSKTKQVISFTILSTLNFTHYTATKEFSSTDSWTKVSLSPTDFKSINGEILSSWQNILTFNITSSEEFLLNSMLWV